MPLPNLSFGNANYTEENVTFDGYLGMLQSGQIDVLVSSSIWERNFAQYFNFLHPLESTQVSFLFRVEESPSFYRMSTTLVNQLGAFYTTRFHARVARQKKILSCAARAMGTCKVLENKLYV